MIEVKKANKYFNRHQKNEIHVIADTSIELAGSGLVALLGPSGCGKTTLLNVIGGLDKVNSGAIYIDGKRLTGRTDNAVDNIRNRDIGYVFQDYHLIDELTVFDNVALALKMVGITAKPELESRVGYVLQAVGLYRYRNRYADMLSGGERQRVAIARALVKDPKIIIADEPTGNLDNRNTIEVLNVIKAISAHKLVLLVTHQRQLAEFYATRIIELQDGKVVDDRLKQHDKQLDYRIQQKIYLRDLPKQAKVNVGNLAVTYYGDDSEAAQLLIVAKNNSIYLQSPQQRVESVDNNSAWELIDAHYQKINQQQLDDSFDLNKAKLQDYRLHYHSIYNFFTMLTAGITKIMSYSLLRKILLLAFLVTAMFVTYSFSSTVATFTYDDSYFLVKNKDYLDLTGKFSVEEYQALRNDKELVSVLIGNSKYNFIMPLKDYYQTGDQVLLVETSLTALSKLESDKLLFGRLPENSNEVVIDRMCLDVLSDNLGGRPQQAGILRLSDYLGKYFRHGIVGELYIVGITDQKSPSLYLDPDLFINIISETSDDMYYTKADYFNEPSEQRVYDYNYARDLKLKKGHWPTKDYEVVVNYDSRYEMKLHKTVNYRVNGKKLKVVGYYKSNRGDYRYYVNENTLAYQLLLGSQELSLLATDKQAAMDRLAQDGYNITDSYQQAKHAYIDSRAANTQSQLTFNVILAVIAVVQIYLVIRSSFLARIKEVGVYRAIGMKKRDLLKMFLGEILIITVLADFTGVALMYYILTGTRGIPYMQRLFVLKPEIGLAAGGGLLAVNIIFGLLPVYLVIRHKPAAILARSDI